MNENIQKKFGMTLDPIHVGTGGYRLGRVDNTIVREPGTTIPKIPGTTIEGSARTYAYYKEKENNSHINDACALGKEIKREKETIKPCGKCSVCITFGFTRDDKSLHGMAQFSDARILFFPVHSMLGPVWVTSPSVLKEVGLEGFSVGDETMLKTSLIEKGEKLNLGWLYLENENNITIGEELNDIPSDIKNRFVLVSDKLFSRIVNSNLEVRTSVAIDPRTGAAEEGALFTYEAIPRAVVLWFDVTYLNPKWFDCKIEKNNSEVNPNLENDIKPMVRRGLKLFEILGIGGMGTRGFGRLKILNLEGDSNGGE